MDVTRLRTLTKKSCLKFGKYGDYKVGDILALRHTAYLRWVYYNMSKISFIKEILREIHIHEDWEIEKPGKAPEKFDELTARIFRGMYYDDDPLRQIKTCKKVKKNLKLHYVRQSYSERFKNSKSYLQSRNHGR